MKLTGENLSTRRKTCPSATLSTTNPTWNDPGSKPGLRGERPETNGLSHGMAHRSLLVRTKYSSHYELNSAILYVSLGSAPIQVS
jgi:hypothetical protein